MPAKPQTFGRRRAVPDPIPARSSSAASLPGLPPAAAALLPKIAPPARTAETGPRTVPRSLRATLIAGLVIGLIQAGISAEGAPVPDLLSAALGATGTPGVTLPLVLSSGLLSGLENAFAALAVVRWLLNQLGRTGPIDYAVCGAALAVLCAAGAQLLGLGRLGPNLAFDVAISGAAALLYRLFAGTQPRPE